VRYDVLQVVAIACHGNAYFAQPGDSKIPELLGGNTVFQNVGELGFDRKGQSNANGKDGTAPWLGDLRANGVERLIPMLHGCSLEAKRQGAEPWGLISDGERGCEVWQPVLKLRSLDKTEKRPWRVIYTGERFNRWSLKPVPTPEDAADKMAHALRQGVEFGAQHQLRTIQAPLERLTVLHHQHNPELIGFPDLCPEAFSNPARISIAAALRVLLIQASETWDPAALPEECRTEFIAISMRLWQSAMLCFEAGIAIGLQEQEPPMALRTRHLEAS
jgi:hypothetical protein